MTSLTLLNVRIIAMGGTKSDSHKHEIQRAIIKYYETGQKVSREKILFHKVWNEMKRRCDISSHPAYHNYGGRGITVDKSWYIFENFYNDMFLDYRQGLTIDRIDNEKGYSKNNCRWATPGEQMNNIRTNKVYSLHGKTMGLGEWSKELGVKKKTLEARIRDYKWPIEKTLT
jgi:hypothetical protein